MGLYIACLCYGQSFWMFSIELMLTYFFTVRPVIICFESYNLMWPFNAFKITVHYQKTLQ